MAMKLIKKTAEYSIFARGDDRYAVKDGDKKPVNGDEKVKILLAEGLIKVTEPSAPAEPEPEEAAAEEEAPAEEEAADADDAADDAADEEADSKEGE